jgi:hypothetical protein
MIIADIMTLLLWGVSRGTKVFKLKTIARTNEKGRKIIDTLKVTYGIRDHKPEAPTDITIGRLMATYPSKVAELLNKGYGRVVGEGGGDLPMFLKFPAAPSIIPSTDGALYEAWLQWAITFDKIITDDPTPLATIKSYGEIAWKSGLHTDEERRTILDRLRA